MSTTGTAPIAPHAADDAAAAFGQVLTAMVTPFGSHGGLDDSAAEFVAGWLTRDVARATKTETRRHNGRPFDGQCSELSAMRVSGMTMAPRWDQ